MRGRGAAAAQVELADEIASLGRVRFLVVELLLRVEGGVPLLDAGAAARAAAAAVGARARARARDAGTGAPSPVRLRWGEEAAVQWLG